MESLNTVIPLPLNFQHRIQESSVSDSHVTATVHANLLNLKDADDWIAEYSSLTRSNWNVRHSRPKGVILRKDYVCHLMDYKQKPRKGFKSANRYKSHSCPAKIVIKIKKINLHSKQRYSWVRDGMPATIYIDANHNHSLEDVKTLSLRKLDPSVRERFMVYFDQGMSVPEAYEYHNSLLHLDPSIDSPLDQHDSAYYPNKSAVAYLYRQWRDGNGGERAIPEISEFKSEPDISDDLEEQTELFLDPAPSEMDVEQAVQSLCCSITDTTMRFLPQCDASDIINKIDRIKDQFNRVQSGSQLCTLLDAVNLLYSSTSVHFYTPPSSMSQTGTSMTVNGTKRSNNDSSFDRAIKAVKTSTKLALKEKCTAQSH